MLMAGGKWNLPLLICDAEEKPPSVRRESTAGGKDRRLSCSVKVFLDQIYFFKPKTVFQLASTWWVTLTN